ncbi:chloride channel protein [Pseudolabrys taiwanensis]|uniref:Chloride channel protein n=1 Tax=Pseudolabrys taiwanensis TaxID=331696 RepID=A0A345ZQZ4_9HYPH|nr:chloride channel protein [Pseudolabrys taiwanensis]AXK79341.1 chloride channel protein [Pseudolabrys taiwanensis]
MPSDVSPDRSTRSPVGPQETGGRSVQDRLRDFSTDRRLFLLVGMALIVGCAGAAAAWALYHLIALATNIAYYGRFSTAPASPPDHGLGWLSVLIPVTGCIIIGLMARFGSEKIRGHGIPEAMEAILIGRSRIQPRVALLKPLSSAISIGTGGPFGAEGPIIMTGGAFGSLFAQLFHLTSAERKTLLVAGAAAGMSATFGTPVAAMLLAVELLLFEWKPRSFVPVAIASIIAAALRPYLLGGGVLFPMAESAEFVPLALGCAAVLGVVAGLASGLLTQMVYACEDAFQRLPIHWMWWPALGGVVIGVGGMIEPRALGVGYDNIAALLNGQMSTVEIVRLIAVKAIIWSVALGSGTSGGVLAPLLMMGGALGALFGGIVPFGDGGTWALIGMAAIMGGTMRSPLTAIVFALELTHNVDALVPVTVACVLAHATTVLLLRRSILTEKVARRGHHVMREYVVDPFEMMRVSDIMARPVETLPADMPVADVVTFFTSDDMATRHKSYPIIDADRRLVGMVSRSDVLRWTVEGWGTGQVLREAIGEQDVTVGYEDELVGRLADRMAALDASRVPILRRSDNAVVGLVARRDLLRVRAQGVRHETEREILLRLRRGPAEQGDLAARGGQKSDARPAVSG